MSLILHSYNDYDPDRIERDKFVKGEENPSGEGNWVRPYYDGSIAVGYGFDLLVRSTTEINSHLGKTNDALGLTGSQRISLPSSDIPLLAAAQNGNRKRTAARLSLALPSEAYSAKLTNILLNEFESALDTALGFCLVPSKEKTAILSLLYTLTNPTASAIKRKIPSTLEAIKNNNRAEAWYEIRYGSNKGFGHTARRYREAQLFDLYDEGPLYEDQAKEVVRMYTIHEITETNQANKMSTYESNRRTRPPQGINTITQEVLPAREFLIASYSSGMSIDGQVMVGAGLDTYAYKEKVNINDNLVGSAKADLIFGEKGDDVIYGGEGDDVIYGGDGKDKLYGGENNDLLVGGDQDDVLEGGAGNDTLYGGEGNDTYIINTGDGDDTIEDKQGINTVKLCGEVISVFWNKKNGTSGEWEWVNTSGKLRAYKSGTDLIVEHENGMRVTLNEDFEWGDFGTSLVDVPDDPSTTLTITGDLAPIDSDPNTPGVQIQYDALGNAITDPNTPEPDRADTLYDSTGNDSIVGGGGNDQILAENGGDDWLKGHQGDVLKKLRNLGSLCRQPRGHPVVLLST